MYALVTGASAGIGKEIAKYLALLIFAKALPNAFRTGPLW